MDADLDVVRRKSRLQTEVLQLAERYGEVTYDSTDGEWVHVSCFPLPPGWNKIEVEILIDIPHGRPAGYPIVAPDWFWTDRELRTNDGKSIKHFFTERGAYNNPTDRQYLDKGWGHFCVHLTEWRPVAGSRYREGHTLSSYLNLMALIFRDRGALVDRQHYRAY